MDSARNSHCEQAVGTSIEVAFQNVLRLTVDFFQESLPYCRLWFQKLTILSTMVSKVDRTVDTRDYKKKIATVATNRLSIFPWFCCGFFIGFQWENGRIRTKWPQNLQKFPSKLTVDYVADPRSCNSLLFSRKLTNCRLKKKNPTTVDSWSTFIKKSRNSRFIVKSRLSTSRLLSTSCNSCDSRQYGQLLKA